MHEQMKKYWQDFYNYSEVSDDTQYSPDYSRNTAAPATSNKDINMDRYKGEITKLERSMKAIQHQRHNARR